MKIAEFGNPGAWIPIALSLTGLLMVVGHTLVFGIVHEADEGAAAHIFQMLMAAQIPFVVWHLVVWLPRDARRGLGVFAAQVLAASIAMMAVFLLT
jgi:cytochrome bd-type quinol oxidase subunit 2